MFHIHSIEYFYVVYMWLVVIAFIDSSYGLRSIDINAKASINKREAKHYHNIPEAKTKSICIERSSSSSTNTGHAYYRSEYICHLITSFCLLNISFMTH